MLEGKLALIFGVANKRSIAWAIAQALAGSGARLVLTYQERVEKYVQELAETIPGTVTVPCDVESEQDLDRVFDLIARDFGGLDILIHSIAFAPQESLEGRFIETSREAFRTALEVSAYSLVELARRAEPLMEKQGAGRIVTMTYLGAERVVPNYNVMGVAKAALEASVRYLAADLGPKNITVNAISAGPLRTLSARVIAGFPKMEEHIRERAPLRRNTEASEVGDTALYLCSSLGRGLTGEILHVDAGYHAMGM